MSTNVVGATNVLKFAKSCPKVKMLLHVSTAYVCGKTTGVLLEKPFQMGKTLTKNYPYLDINMERGVIANKIKELETQNATSKEVTIAMKELGLQRTLDAFVLAYGKGALKFYYGDPDSKLDAIPGDMVVNSILAAVIAHENQYSQEVVIYHSSSSLSNPLKISEIMHFGFHYLTKNPWVNKNGKTIKVRAPMLPLSTMARFRKHIKIHYLPLLKGSLMFILHSCFDKGNNEKLRLGMKEINMDGVLNFDPRCIKWRDYFINTHFPGAVKYLF
ncbi:hypothetical protein P3S68_012957 [Capsicum galapagoense]